MQKVTEYLERSAECRELSTKAPTAELRKHYVALADMWKRLADERMGSLSSQQK